MTHQISVTFRGEERDVTNDQDHGYEPDTNAQEIEWHFTGLSPEDHGALVITTAEEQAIFEACVEAGWEADEP